MTTRRYVQIDGQLYERGKEPVEGVFIMDDIQPYQSQITGEMITSRSQHREHLKAHGCFEVGDQAHHLPRIEQKDVNPEGRKELIRAQFDAMDHKTFKRALQRDIDRIKWNSRG